MTRDVEDYAERAFIWSTIVAAATSKQAGLSDVELSVMLMIFAGHNVNAIARSLDVSRQRVQQARRHAWGKVAAVTGLRNSPNWVWYAQQIQEART